MKTSLMLCLTVTLVFGWIGIGSAQQSTTPPQGKIPPEAWQWVETTDVVRIILQLDVPWKPEGHLDQEAILAQRQASVTAMNNLLASLTGTKYRMVLVTPGDPIINMEVAKDALAVLDRSPLVKSITLIPLLPQGRVPVEVWQEAWATGGVSIIVALHTDIATTPLGALNQPAQRRAIAAAQDKLLTRLDRTPYLAGPRRTPYKVTQRLTIMPIIGLVLLPDALIVVDRFPLVKRVVVKRLWVDKIPEEVWQIAQKYGAIRIMVQLNVPWKPEVFVPWKPEDYLGKEGVLAQRQAIAEAQDELTASLVGTVHRVIVRFWSIPRMDMEVGVDALIVLERSPLVIGVQKELIARPTH